MPPIRNKLAPEKADGMLYRQVSLNVRGNGLVATSIMTKRVVECPRLMCHSELRLGLLH